VLTTRDKFQVHVQRRSFRFWRFLDAITFHDYFVSNRFAKAMIQIARGERSLPTYVFDGTDDPIYFSGDKWVSNRIEYWRKFAGGLSESALSDLIKGIVLTEEWGEKSFEQFWEQELKRKSLQENISEEERIEENRIRRTMRNQETAEPQETSLSDLIRIILSFFARPKISPRPYREIGSTTKVHYLFRPYAERFSQHNTNDLAKWCLKNSTNPYVPYGTSNKKGAHYVHYSGLHMKRRSLHERRKSHDEILKAKGIAGKEDRKNVAEERTAPGKERGQQVSDFNNSLRELPTLDAFEAITESDLPLEVVRLEALLSIPEIASSLDERTKSLLLVKIDRRKKGFWGKLGRHLGETT
jgi:hypothetical protein